MSVKSLIRIAEGYLKKHPVPSDVSLFGNLLKLSYVYSTPYTNSKNKEEMIFPLSDTPTKKKQKLTSKTLNFDEKNNRIEQSNSFESISTE